MRYVRARYDTFERDEVYRSYVARSLQIAPRNQSIVPTYEEMLNPQEVDHRSGDEIACDMIVKAGLNFGEIKS